MRHCLLLYKRLYFLMNDLLCNIVLSRLKSFNKEYMLIKDNEDPQGKSPTGSISGNAIGRLFGGCDFTPRISLFIFAIVIKLAASAVSGIAYVLNNSILYMAGIMLWILWFAFLFIIAIPKTDQWLKKNSAKFRKAAKNIIVIIVVIGIAEFVGMSIIGLDAMGIKDKNNDLSSLFTSLEESFNYNDATALCHQAAECRVLIVGVCL